MLALCLLALVEGALLFAAASLRDPLARLPLFLALYAGAFGACVLAARAARSAGLGALTAGTLLFVVAVGAIFRAFFLPTPPALSGDVHRYVWDARAQAAGINPYAHPPNAPEVAFLRDADTDKISHPEISTIYPPVSQAVFRIAGAVAPGPLGMKILFGLVSLVLPLAAVVWLRPAAPDWLPALVLLAWHPLLVIESAGSGHNDPLAALLFLAAVGAAHRGRAGLAGALLGLAAGAKTLPLLLAPLFALALGRRRALPFAASLAATLLLGYVPFAGAGGGLLVGLREYVFRLEFNSSVHAVARALLARAGAPHALRDGLPSLLPLGVIAAQPLLFRAAGRDLPRALFLTLGALVVVGSQVHPWYMIWILPFAAARGSAPWIAFSLLVFLSYATHALHQATGVWREPVWVRAAQYVPLFALLARDAARLTAGRARARDGTPSRGSSPPPPPSRAPSP